MLSSPQALTSIRRQTLAPTKWGRIREWTALPRDKRQSMEQIAAYAKTAAQQNENAFVHSRRDPYEKIMGWLLPRAGRPY